MDSTTRTTRILTWLREGRVLIDHRSRIAVFIYALMALPLLLLSLSTYFKAGLTNGLGNMLGEDFINYWMGARFGVTGLASQIYDTDVYMPALEDFAQTSLDFYNYSYPPSLMLITLPLAFLPFVAAFVVWTLAGFGVVFAMLRTFWDTKSSLLAVAATPAIFLNAAGGQNGALSAGFLGGGLLLLQRSPLVAGMLFGALSYKPHLGVLIPLALACGGYWRAFVSAAVTVVLLIVLTGTFYGWEAWIAYADRFIMMGDVLDGGGIEFWQRMPTTYASALFFDFGRESAFLFHLPVALYAVTRVISVWRRPQELLSVKAATLALSTFVVTPYLWDYDMLVMIVIFAWRIHEGHLQPWEGTALALVVILPYILIIVVNLLSFPIGPVVVVFALWAVSVKSSQSEKTFTKLGTEETL